MISAQFSATCRAQNPEESDRQGKGEAKAEPRRNSRTPHGDGQKTGRLCEQARPRVFIGFRRGRVSGSPNGDRGDERGPAATGVPQSGDYTARDGKRNLQHLSGQYTVRAVLPRLERVQ